MGRVKELYMDVFELYEANKHSVEEIAEQLGVDSGLVTDIVYDIVGEREIQQPDRE